MLARAGGAIGQPERAARLLGLVQQVWDTVGVANMGLPALLTSCQFWQQRIRKALGDEAYQTAYQTGYDTDIETGIAYALDLPSIPQRA
jgi:hypothetical protein